MPRLVCRERVFGSYARKVLAVCRAVHLVISAAADEKRGRRFDEQRPGAAGRELRLQDVGD
ncbi:MAG TPA: hypothetical protein VGF69_14845, partial [Thermoanaerobaculia bacterium]